MLHSRIGSRKTSISALFWLKNSHTTFTFYDRFVCILLTWNGLYFLQVNHFVEGSEENSPEKHNSFKRISINIERMKENPPTFSELMKLKGVFFAGGKQISFHKRSTG
jgi:hypothetical protein